MSSGLTHDEYHSYRSREVNIIHTSVYIKNKLTNTQPTTESIGGINNLSRKRAAVEGGELPWSDGKKMYTSAWRIE